MSEGISRRSFLIAGGAAVLSSQVLAAEKAKPKKPEDPFKGTHGAPFTVGAPCLQAPAPTTMGVSWAVSGLSKGEVEVSRNADMSASRKYRSGGFGLIPIDIAALQVRLENLKPATKYYYRTITTPFTDYSNIYNAKLGAPVISEVHSFTTPGEKARTHFAVMNDTHAQWRSFGPTVAFVKALKPDLLIWNGDATNTTQDKATAVEIFLNPPVADKDFSTDIPVGFVSGNHDFRGSWISKKEEVMLPRHPAERSGSEWDLKWNFAFRQGDVALIGMDTGEDKPDGHPKWFGLANFSPYRKAQAKWLKETLKRRDIASAKWKVVICHIPLFAAPESPDYKHDGVKIHPSDYAWWSRECNELWAPILNKNKVTLAICAHTHMYRYDEPTADRPWAQLVGGGPETGKFGGPTVIEGTVEKGRLKITVHKVEIGDKPEAEPIIKYFD